MQQKPYVHEYTQILKTCICKQSLGEGRNAHHHIIQNGLNADIVIGSSLIDMYAKCGSLEEAINLFDRLPLKTVVTWGIMMSAYTQNGQGLFAIKLLDVMQRQGVYPDKVIHICMLKASGSIKSSMHGMSTHALVLKYGLESDIVIGSALIDMYAKGGNIETSRYTFDKMPTRNIVLWSSIISSYVQRGDGLSALALYKKMQLEGLKPNKFIMSSILKGCALVGDYAMGKQVHEEIGQFEFESDVVLGNALVDMYAKLGRLHEAYEIFAALPLPNLVSWGAIITGHVQHGHSNEAIELFMEMHQKKIEPNLVILSCILQACGKLGCVRFGKLVHDYIIRNGAGQDDVVACSLVDMYAKCGGLIDGWKLLEKFPKNIAAWGAMMSGCIEHGEPHVAMSHFQSFLQHGVELNKVLCLCIIRACGSMGFCDQGMLVHSMMVSMGLEIDVVIGSSLVDMYTKCGTLEDASKVFSQLRHPDMVTWGTMIIGHVQQGHDLFALQLFEDMQQAGIRPSNVIYPSIVKACGNLEALMHGQLIHDLINRSEVKADLAIENSLIEMYKKCGCVYDAQRVCNNISSSPSDNIISRKNISFRQCMRGTLESGCIRSSNDAIQGSAGECQVNEDFSTSAPSVACVLAPIAEHCNDMIYNLGRVGSLLEAKHLLQTMPVLPDDIGWTSLLTSCRAYGDTEIGKHCYDHAVQAAPKEIV